MSKKEELFTSELNQAWDHYRHLEETRTKFLNFFFTMFLGSVGFLITLFNQYGSENTYKFYLSLSLFVSLIFIISIIIFSTITRIGYVLKAYELIFKKTREHYYGKESGALKLWSIRKNIPKSVSKGLFSVQNSSKFLLVIFCFVLTLIQLLLMVLIFNHFENPIIGAIMPFIFILAMIGTYFFYKKQLNSAESETSKIIQTVDELEININCESA